MIFSRKPVAVTAAVTVFLVGNAWAEEAARPRAALKPAAIVSACTRPAPGQAEAETTSSFTLSPGDGAGVQVRIAIGTNAVAVNNSGGVVFQPPRPGPCPENGRD